MARGITKKSIVSFNAGELSPLLDARVDLDKYSSGCRKLQNAITRSYGGVNRRPGTQFIAEAKHHDRKCRVIDFQFSTTTTFTLEVGHEYFRFYSNGGQVQSGGSAYEISSPYDESDLFQLQYAQINDVIYFVHPDYAVRKLSRIADTNWTLEEVEFNLPPLLDENLTDTTVTASGTTLNSSITLTASADLFTSDHVGAYWQLGHRREANSVEIDLTANGNTSAVVTKGEWTVRTYGIWVGTILVQRSEDGSTNWETIREFTGDEDRNIDAVGEEFTESHLRVKYENYSAPASPGSVTPRAVLEVVDSFVYGFAKITAYTDARNVTATVKDSFHSTSATKVWSEGAWSPLNGYPRTVTRYERRVVYAGSKEQPQTVWASVSSDFDNFSTGTNDTDSFNYTLGAQERNSIEWLIYQGQLLIGTSGGEWSMTGSNQEPSITPTNVSVKRQSTYGSNNIRATLVNEVVLFTQRQGKKVRELVFSFERDGFVAPDLTLLSEHITDGGVVDTAYQQQEDSIFWAVTEKGTLIGMTYERDQNVTGWHRHITDGLFESVATIYGDSDDEVWFSVKRTIGGSTKRYIERFNPVEWVYKEDAFFVDSGLTYDSSASTTISGLSHLEGETVTVLADGSVVSDKVVSGGKITLDIAASVVHVGLKYETIIQPMRIDIDALAGVTQGETKQVRELVVRFLNSLGVSYSDGVDEFETLSFRDTSNPMDGSPPLFTGDKVIEFEGDFEFEGNVIIKQDQPLPMTILLAVVKYQVTGR